MSDDLSFDVKVAIQRAVLFHPLFEGTAAEALEIAIAAIKAGDEICASSPAQEPVTTEPVARRYQRKEWGALLWRYQTEALVNDDFETPSDWIIEPLYAIPAPPQPGRDNDKHYLAAIRHHLKRLYSVYPNNARLREQISDEIDWIDATLTGESK